MPPLAIHFLLPMMARSLAISSTTIEVFSPMSASLPRCAIVFSAILLPQGATAQVREATDTALQTACHAAARRAAIPSSLRSGVSGLKACGMSGPAIIARVWPAFTSDDTTLNALVESSRFLRDTRMLTVVGGLALGESNPQRLRLAALQVMLNYADATAVAVPSQLEHAIAGTAGRLYGETEFHPTTTTMPLEAASATYTGSAFATLAPPPPQQ